MSKNLFDLFRRPASTTDEIAETLKEVTGAIPDARSTVDRLVAERRKKLPFASDDEIVKLERQIADARREADRLEAAQEHIAGRHAEKMAAEARAALDRERADAEMLADILIEKVATDYPKLANAIASIITELDAGEAKIQAVNKKLIEAGRASEAIPPIEDSAIKFRAVSYREIFRLRTSSLPPAPGFAGFGEAAIRARLDGVQI